MCCWGFDGGFNIFHCYPNRTSLLGQLNQRVQRGIVENLHCMSGPGSTFATILTLVCLHKMSEQHGLLTDRKGVYHHVEKRCTFKYCTTKLGISQVNVDSSCEQEAPFVLTDKFESSDLVGFVRAFRRCSKVMQNWAFYYNQS